MVLRRPGGRLDAWSLMVAIAIVAVGLAAARVDSAPGAGIAMIIACIGFSAYRRYSETMAPRRASGQMTGPLRRAGLFLASASVALAIIGLSDFAFVVGRYGYLKIASRLSGMTHWKPYDDANCMARGGVMGVVLALCVASSLRRTVYPPGRVKPMSARTWLALWPVGLVIILVGWLGVESTRERYSYCRMMVWHHAAQEAHAASPKDAALHAWLKRWYAHAAVRPWLPNNPTRIPPGAITRSPAGPVLLESRFRH